MDFNLQLHETVCELLGLERETVTLDSTANIEGIDLRRHADPAQGIPEGYTPLKYYQVFERRNGFLPDISIADLLFNMGPEGLITLRDVWKKHTD